MVAPQKVPRILGKLLKAKGLPNETSSNAIPKESSICTSTAYEDCETPSICLTMKWGPSWMGEQAQYPHYTVFSNLKGIPIIPVLTSTRSLFGETNRNVMWTHPYANPQYMKVVKHLL